MLISMHQLVWNLMNWVRTLYNENYNDNDGVSDENIITVTTKEMTMMVVMSMMTIMMMMMMLMLMKYH